MNRFKDNTLNTIISITKERVNSNNKSTKNNEIKKGRNDNDKNHNYEEKLNNFEEDDDDEEDRKYFEFNAHFKYQELVEALNALKSKKNESTSNTSNANINNNINNKNSIKESNTHNTNSKNNNNNNCILNNYKAFNYKGISRNIQMNNYIKYLDYIEENKDNNIILTSIANNIHQNKTSFLPQTELLKKKINFQLQKLNELKNQKQDKISSSKNKKKLNNYNKITKENKLTYNQKYNNLITI